MGFFDVVTHSQIACYKCSAPILIENGRLARLRQTGENFWCPNGHGQCFTPSENTKLKKQLADMTMYRDNAQADRDHWKMRREKGILEENRLARRIYALRGVITRMKNKLKPKP